MSSAVLFLGFHDQASSHHYSLRKHYAGEGCALIEGHTDARGFIRKCTDLLRKYRIHKNAVHTVVVTFPGHHLLPFAWLLTRWPRKRLVFDMFVSAYDTLVTDRQKYARWHPMAWFLYFSDWVNVRLADEVLMDTRAHRDFIAATFRIPGNRIRVIFLEAQPGLFHPDTAQRERSREGRTTFDVLFYGSYIPLQGIEHMLRAAALLQQSHPHVRFTFIGGGQTEKAMRALAQELSLNNVRFEPFQPLAALPDRIRSADLCLGIFGTGGKAQRVIPHKVVETVACGVPVLTADTPAIRERYAGNPLVLLCRAGDPKDIAHSIRHAASSTHALHHDP